jgi:hypothetical protein
MKDLEDASADAGGRPVEVSTVLAAAEDQVVDETVAAQRWNTRS